MRNYPFNMSLRFGFNFQIDISSFGHCTPENLLLNKFVICRS